MCKDTLILTKKLIQLWKIYIKLRKDEKDGGSLMTMQSYWNLTLFHCLGQPHLIRIYKNKEISRFRESGDFNSTVIVYFQKIG